MLDMTLYVDEQPHYITDLKVNDEGMMEITFADGKVTKEEYSEHNYNFYRGRMVEQVYHYADDAIKDFGVSWIKTKALRYGTLLSSLVGMFFLYNIDIHVIMKIIITALIVLGESALLFFTQLYLVSLEDDSIEALAYQEYVKHLDNFKYFDAEKGLDHYIFPIEDIEKQHMDYKFVKKIDSMITEMKGMGSKKENIRIDYGQTDDTKLRK